MHNDIKIEQINEEIKNPITSEASVYTGMNKVFDLTRELLSALSDNDHITTKDLAIKVYAQLDKDANMSVTTVQDLVKMYIKGTNGIYKIEVGRDGGVYKGGRPIRKDPRRRCQTCNQIIRQSAYEMQQLPEKLVNGL